MDVQVEADRIDANVDPSLHGTRVAGDTPAPSEASEAAMLGKSLDGETLRQMYDEDSLMQFNKLIASNDELRAALEEVQRAPLFPQQQVMDGLSLEPLVHVCECCVCICVCECCVSAVCL